MYAACHACSTPSHASTAADSVPGCPYAVIARDLQSVVFYDSKGAFVGVRRPGSGKPIEVEGLKLVVDQVW